MKQQCQKGMWELIRNKEKVFEGNHQAAVLAFRAYTGFNLSFGSAVVKIYLFITLFWVNEN